MSYQKTITYMDADYTLCFIETGRMKLAEKIISDNNCVFTIIKDNVLPVGRQRIQRVVSFRINAKTVFDLCNCVFLIGSICSRCIKVNQYIQEDKTFG